MACGHASTGNRRPFRMTPTPEFQPDFEPLFPEELEAFDLDEVPETGDFFNLDDQS